MFNFFFRKLLLSSVSVARDSVLITGGNGCIGKEVVERLIRDGRDVTLITSRAPETQKKKEGVTLVQTDLCSTEAHDATYWKNLLDKNGISKVVHLAGATSLSQDKISEGKSLLDINTYPTAAIAAAAQHQGAHMIYVSSAATNKVYPNDLTDYSHSKSEAEKAVRQINSFTIVKPDLVFGDTVVNGVTLYSMHHAWSPDQVATLSSPTPIIGSGYQTLQPVSLTDVADGIKKILDNSEEYNKQEFDFVGPDIISQSKLLDLFKARMGKDFYPLYIQDPKTQDSIKKMAEAAPCGSFNPSLIGALQCADDRPSVAGFNPGPFCTLLGRPLTPLSDVLSRTNIHFEGPPMLELAKGIMGNAAARSHVMPAARGVFSSVVDAIIDAGKKNIKSGNEAERGK